ncbi:hypothetical protein KX928_15645 [Roseobacter sp. YSTF-M11]|uniref:Uncharacterized protein n=1 Tax=Roseobacter insulae TaxID=2859783 RepID=A0A9X1FY83_9RHOB|nr:hypothetical protein [Roseobacter insulae]MBW4709225.1 hypothetical protein [Roseobacter insulae]
MIDYAQYLMLTNPLEFYTAIVATLGVAFWMLDRRSIKLALKATKSAEINALRLERQKTEASVERSFGAFQLQCHASRSAWRDHEWRNGPQLRSPLHSSEEQKEIRQLEMAARANLEQFNASAPDPDSFEVEKLAAYFTEANRTSLAFAKLASQLPKPKNRFL